MGNAVTSASIQAPLNPSRVVFVEYKTFAHAQRQNKVVVYEFEIGYLRYRWRIYKRFSEFKKLDALLFKKCPKDMITQERFGSSERGTVFGNKTDGFLHNRGKAASVYLQVICDNKNIFASAELQDFIGLLEATLKAEYGRKGPEGMLQIGSGGFFAKHPTPLLVHGWSLAWVAMRDTQILMLSGRKDAKLVGTLLIDQGFAISCRGANITIKTHTRTLAAQASSEREAYEWTQAANSFYATIPRSKLHPFGASFPVRLQTDVRMYEVSSKLYQNAAISMLKAAESIFICTNELYPSLILTRPPLPTVRLDQILKLKADQGVKIYIILFKENQSTSSFKSEDVKNMLKSLNPSIEVLRHSNTVKPQWIHNENLIIVDRNVAYLCGSGLSAGSWDDERHLLVDEDGISFPGLDYDQPSPFLHKPVRTEDQGYFESDPLNMPPAATLPDGTLDDPFAGRLTDSSQSSKRDKSFSQRFKGMLAKAIGVDKIIDRKAELRMKLPRRPRHVLSVAVSGLAARDISAHFVQRWNHHRLAKAEYDRSVLSDVTDIPNFVMCARCRMENIEEFASQCPACRSELGPIASFLKSSSPIVSDHKLPDLPSDITYIEYRCEFIGPLFGLVLEGIGPTIVSHTLNTGGPQAFLDGVLVSSNGPLVAELLASYPLRPHSSDVIVSVNFHIVTHLSSDDVARYIRRKKGFMPSSEERVVIVFRRHYVEEIFTLPTATRKMVMPSTLSENVVVGTAVGYSEVPLPNQYGVDTRAPMLSMQHTPTAPPQHFNNYPVVGAPVPMYNPEPPHPVLVPNHGEYEKATAIMYGQAVHATAYASLPIANAVNMSSEPPTMKADPPTIPSVPPASSATPVTAPLIQPVPQASERDSSSPASLLIADERQRPDSLPSRPLSISPGSPQGTVGAEDPQATGQSLRQDQPQRGDASPLTQPTAVVDFPQVPTTAPREIVYDDILPPVPTGELRARQAQIDDSLPTGDRVYEQRAVATSGRKNGHFYESAVSSPQALKMSDHLVLGQRDVEEAVSSNSGRGPPTNGAPGYNNNPTGQPSSNSYANISYGAAAPSTAFLSSAQPTQGAVPTQAPPSGYPQLPPTQQTPIYPMDSSSTMYSNQQAPSPQSYGRPMSAPYNTHAGASFGSTSTLSPYGLGPPPPSTSAYPQANSPNMQQAVPASSEASLSSAQPLDRQAQLEKGKKRAIQLENQLAVGRLVHELKFSNSLISSLTSSGTCHVQVLRSASLWSLGIPVAESSIARAWVDSIKQAQKFIYIESEFLISDPVGAGVKNAVAKALLDRVVDAALRREVFRAVVLLPFTVPGDFIKDERARRAMQAQYQTICRSASSILLSFATRVPGVNPSDFISFFSLRQWGVMNNRIVMDQLTINSNVLVVDDRVAIVGSASISDRGMRGDRNSEVAVRIEDATLIEVPYDGAKFVVGFAPWALRTNLMKAHLGSDSIDISDPISANTYYGSLRGLAGHNCTIFDDLDGPASPYRCASAAAYEAGRESAAQRSYLDPMVQDMVSRIQGRLVFLPLDFLSQP